MTVNRINQGTGRVFALALGTFVTSSVSAENVIDVIGARTEQRYLSRPGQSESIRPDGESRFSIRQHLNERSAFAVPSTGRISASDFVLPRTRGQDPRSTEVYIGTYRLFDPLTGFPQVEDLDLRALGKLQLHRGVSPVDVASTNPVGAMVFAPSGHIKSVNRLGLSYGRPSGIKSWALSQGTHDRWSGQLYGRIHKTDGRYPFFSDNGTPANRSDDETLWRQDNQAQSWQMVPRARFRVSRDLSLSWLGVYGGSHRGLPVRGGRLETGATSRSQSQITFISAAKSFTTQRVALAPRSWQLLAALRGESRLTEDKSGLILTEGRRKTFTTAGNDFAWPWQWAGGNWGLQVRPEWGHHAGRIRTDSARSSDLERTYQQILLGGRTNVFHRLSVELKSRWRVRRDRMPSQSVLDQRYAQDKGSSLAIGWEEPRWAIYAQQGRDERPPSLLEEFGDGGVLLANPGLVAEKIDHREVGASFRYFPYGSMRVAYFNDLIRDKIVLLPALLNNFKATNLRTTEISGMELAADYSAPSSPIFGSIGVSSIMARDRSSSLRETKIPRVPDVVANATVGFTAGNMGKVRLSVRHTGESFDDVLNQVPIPAVTTYDLHADISTQDSDAPDCGVAVANLTNVISIAYDVPGTGEKGRRARSDLSGYPLPGRTWTLDCSWRL